MIVVGCRRLLHTKCTCNPGYVLLPLCWWCLLEQQNLYLSIYLQQLMLKDSPSYDCALNEKLVVDFLNPVTSHFGLYKNSREETFIQSDLFLFFLPVNFRGGEEGENNVNSLIMSKSDFCKDLHLLFKLVFSNKEPKKNIFKIKTHECGYQLWLSGLPAPLAFIMAVLKVIYTCVGRYRWRTGVCVCGGAVCVTFRQRIVPGVCEKV